jgi:DNA-binding response OmpR family regulator
MKLNETSRINEERNHMPNKEGTNILLLENDPILSKILKLTLEQKGLEVYEATSPYKAKEIIEDIKLDALVLDNFTPQKAISHLIDQFRFANPEKDQAILLTTTCRVDDGWRRRHKPLKIIYKPFDVKYFYKALASLLNETC